MHTKPWRGVRTLNVPLLTGTSGMPSRPEISEERASPDGESRRISMLICASRIEPVSAYHRQHTLASLRNGCAFNAEALRTPSHTPSARLPAETHHIPRAQRPVERLRDRIELRRLHEWLPANEFGVLRFCGAVRHLRFQPRSGFSEHLWDGAWRGAAGRRRSANDATPAGPPS